MVWLAFLGTCCHSSPSFTCCRSCELPTLRISGRAWDNWCRDRSNIGNARIAGMGKDLELVGLKYNIAAAVFFVSGSPLDLDLWKLTHSSLDTLLPCGSTIVRIFLNLEAFHWMTSLGTLLSSCSAHQDGVSPTVFSFVNLWSLTSNFQFRVLWSRGGSSWRWCA